MGRTLHARLKPSASEQWGKPQGCPGSVVMQETHPETGRNEAAENGNAEHWAASEILNAYAAGLTLLPSQFVGRMAPNGVTITDEMADAIELYIDDVKTICESRGLSLQLRVERRVEIKRVHPTLCWGTYDGGLILYDAASVTIYIWDYKSGYLPVEAFENWQALLYAIGILDEITGGDGVADQNTNIEIRIVQPRMWHIEGPVRYWRLKGSGLRAKANILNANAALALSDNPPTRTGEQCRFCSARHACETLQRAGLAAMDMAGTATPQLLPDDVLGLEYDFIDRAISALEYRKTGLAAHITGRIEGGNAVAGKVIQQGYGRQKFNGGAEKVVELVAAQMGLNIRKPAQLITPKQCIKAGMPEAVINANSFTPTTGQKLVDSSQSLAARVFSRHQS